MFVFHFAISFLSAVHVIRRSLEWQLTYFCFTPNIRNTSKTKVEMYVNFS